MQMLTDLDKEVERLLREMERTHNCKILIHKDELQFYMSVLYDLDLKYRTGIALSKIGDNKYKLMIAVREYFREEVRNNAR